MYKLTHDIQVKQSIVEKFMRAFQQWVVGKITPSSQKAAGIDLLLYFGSGGQYRTNVEASVINTGPSNLNATFDGDVE